MLVLATTTAGGAGAKSDGAFALPRGQTLYVSGKQWGPYTDFNPFRSGDYATGVVGLVYETLFRYDPLKDRYIPWLATNGRWQGTTYVVTLRRGVTWSDGKPFTARDVKYSYETGKLTGSDIATLWRTGLQAVTTSGTHTVRFRFRGVPNYQQWDWYRYNIPIAPQHIWKGYSATQVTTGNNDNMSRLIGTGPFVYAGGKGSSQTLQWKRRNNWWATKALGKRMWMQYVVDIHNTSNTASLQNFIQGRIDLSNNFFPGVDKLIRGNIQTYYARAPYMLAANTAWLVPNTTKAPLNDRNFRKALATSIDINRIVRDDYGNIVSKASPTGLLPIWNKWIDQAQVARLGFRYSTAQARQILAANGYRDRNNDGFVENKDGSATQPPADRPERLVGLDDRDPDDRRQREGRRHQDHAGLPGLQRPRRGTEHGQVRARPQQRGAARQLAVHLLRVPLPAAARGHADDQELPALPEPAGLEPDRCAQQDAEHERRRGEADPPAAPADHAHGPARDPALVQRHVGPVQHALLDELRACDRVRAAEHAVHVERLLEHDRHRRAGEAEAAQLDGSPPQRSVSRAAVATAARDLRTMRGGRAAEHAMTRYFARKTSLYLLTFFVAVSVDWAIPRLMPGDPVSGLIARLRADPTAAEELTGHFTQSFGFDQPLWQQYLDFWRGLARGDLGPSIAYVGSSVSDLLWNAVPYTLALLVPAIVLSYIAGNRVGAMAARRKVLDNTALPLAYILTATPYMWLALVLAYFFAFRWQVFPVSGAYDFSLQPEWSVEFVRSFASHWFLPFLSLFLVSFGGWAIGMRNLIIYELEADYANYLQALGAPRRLVRQYAYRNAVLPQMSGLALALGAVVGGALVTEIVFGYPGVGSLILTAVQNQDYFLLQGAFLFIIVGVLLANFIVDILYVVVDPRTRVGIRGE